MLQSPPEYGQAFRFHTGDEWLDVEYIHHDNTLITFEAESGNIYEMGKWEYREKLTTGTLIEVDSR